MTTQALEQPQPQAPSEAELAAARATEEADFAAGFANDDGKAPAAAPAKPEDKPAAQAPASEPAAQQPAVAAEPPKAPAFSEADVQRWREAAEALPNFQQQMAAELRKLHGRYGELQGALKQLHDATRGRKLDAALFKELDEEIPGLSTALLTGLNRMFGPEEQPAAAAPATAQPAASVPAQPAPVDETAITERVSAAVGEEKKRNEQAQQRFLTHLHPDWLEVSKEPQYHEWLKSLPGAKRQEILDSADAIVAAGALSTFKAWKAERQKKNARLEAAVSPTGGGGAPAHSQSEEEAFVAGFVGS